MEGGDKDKTPSNYKLRYEFKAPTKLTLGGMWYQEGPGQFSNRRGGGAEDEIEKERDGGGGEQQPNKRLKLGEGQEGLEQLTGMPTTPPTEEPPIPGILEIESVEGFGGIGPQPQAVMLTTPPPSPAVSANNTSGLPSSSSTFSPRSPPSWPSPLPSTSSAAAAPNPIATSTSAASSSGEQPAASGIEVVVNWGTQNRRSSDLICPLCGQESPNVYAYRRHVNMHKGKLPFVCPHCSSPFDSALKVMEHCMKAHAGRMAFPLFKCERCGKPYKIASCLKTHQEKRECVPPPTIAPDVIIISSDDED